MTDWQITLDIGIRHFGDSRREIFVRPDGGRITIGRDPACDVTTSYPALSLRHAMLTIRGGEVFAEDMGSSNGSLIDGMRIMRGEPTLLRVGQCLYPGALSVLLVESRLISGEP
jgi:pSer/pThr/pTyr-binding forkhead associated (FHA) protein